MDSRPIGIFDSGRGGINLLREAKKRLPFEQFIYYNDHKFCPYGDKDESYVKDRIFSVYNRLSAYDIKAFVLACNTATAVGIDELRKHTATEIFGVEPAIKACTDRCFNLPIALLATETTVNSARFKILLQKYSSANTIVIPLKTLASSIEKNLDNLGKINDEILTAVDKCKHCKGVILGCTHYCFILPQLKEIFAPDTLFFDGLTGTARQIERVLKRKDMLSGIGLVKTDIFID